MKSLLVYNWEVRHQYCHIFSQLDAEELVKERTGGLGTILKTLIHIIDVEYSWIRAMFNKPDLAIHFDEYRDLQSIEQLSKQINQEIREYISQWDDQMDHDIVTPSWMTESYRKGDILRHLIVHEIHHMGQLSIWVRELGITPVSSNFIDRD